MIFKQVCIEEQAEGQGSGDGELECMNTTKEAVETTELQSREEENAESCCGDQEEDEVMAVGINALDEVRTDQMDYGKNLHKSLKIEGKELQGDNREVAIEETECFQSEAIVYGSDSEVGHEALRPVLDIPAIKHKNVNDDEKEVALYTEVLEIIEAIGGEEEDEIKHMEKQLVKERELCDQPVEEIVAEKCEEVGWMVEASARVEQSDLQTEGDNEQKTPLEENAWRDIEVTEDAANEEAVVKSLELEKNKPKLQFVACQQKGHEDDAERNMGTEVEESSETIDTDIATTKDDLIIETSQNADKGEHYINDYDDEVGEEDLSDETEDSYSSMEPQQVKLIKREGEGKIQEDKSVEEGKHDFHDSKINRKGSLSELQVKAEAECNSQKNSEIIPTMADSTQFMDGKGNSEKTFTTEKCVVDVAALNDHSTNATRWRVLVWIVFVLSSLSYSWFFGLSFFKLCFIVFFTVVVSKFVGLHVLHREITAMHGDLVNQAGKWQHKD